MVQAVDERTDQTRVLAMVWVGGMPCATEAFAVVIICIALPSTWVIVFARGLIEVASALDAAGLGPARPFFRARLWMGLRSGAASAGDAAAYRGVESIVRIRDTGRVSPWCWE